MTSCKGNCCQIYQLLKPLAKAPPLFENSWKIKIILQNIRRKVFFLNISPSNIFANICFCQKDLNKMVRLPLQRWAKIIIANKNTEYMSSIFSFRICLIIVMILLFMIETTHLFPPLILTFCHKGYGTEFGTLGVWIP